MDYADTIFAVATARGKAGVGVVRVSGALAHEAALALAGDVPDARRAVLRKLRNPKSGDIIDEALLLVFDHGKSFTGEQAAEFHTHGSIAVLTAILGILAEMKGFRLAEPGEFSRRALENGRMDLAQIEGLGDLISAETEAQRRAALQVMQGNLSERIAIWRQQLLRISALQAAMIDFADEDVPDLNAEIADLIAKTVQLLRNELVGSAARERLQDGFEVAILGRPNVGKSTLLNALAGRKAALTSEIAGTTRDVIEVRMDLSGLPVTLLDTAGLRETDDIVETLGIDLAIQRARSADLRIFLVESNQADLPLGVGFMRDDIRVVGKADIIGQRDAVSGKTGAGIDILLTKITETLSQRLAGSGVTIRERHRVAIGSAVSGLERALERVKTGIGSEDLAAEEVLAAMRSLDVIVGKVDVEQMLGEIFSSFCIGK